MTTSVPAESETERARDPGVARALAGASALISDGRLDDAEAAVLAVLGAVPRDRQALKLLALVRYKLGRLEEALAAYRDLAASGPEDASARRNYGLIALKLGRVQDALPELQMAVHLAPGDARAWSYLGYALAKKGDVTAAAAAFRKAGQDALAAELDDTAKARRATDSVGASRPDPATVPVVDPGRGASVAAAAPAPPVMPAIPFVAHAPERPPRLRAVALAPPLPPPASGSGSGSGEATAGSPDVDDREGRERAAARARARSEARAARSLSPPVVTEPRASGVPIADAPTRHRDVAPIPLLSFVLSRLEQVAPLPAAGGPLKLAVIDEAYVRADALLAGSGALRWEPAYRRAQGRRTHEPLGPEQGRVVSGEGSPNRYFRLTGGGDVWIAGIAGRWLPLALDDDVLYVREDRVLAFDGSLSWEAGAVPGGGAVRMLQFRGRGIVALELDAAPIAIKMSEERVTLLATDRLVGWVGRLVPYAARLDSDAPFQVACQGEGVVLLEPIHGRGDRDVQTGEPRDPVAATSI